MASKTEQRSRRGVHPPIIRFTMAALVAATLVAATLAGVGSPAGAVAPAAVAPGAAATVPNGLTTTDLNAIGMSPTSLASSLVGPGVTVSNVTFSGANAQAGSIHVVDPAVVSFNDGVIMSTGNIADVVGPNKSDGTTGDMAGPNDPQLDALIAATQTVNPVTFDAASLEFDFVPTASQVYFTYTFTSDEYLEWVNLFNDVFAFFVNGQNCATVPGGAPVSIDTINSAVNPNLFRDNSFSNPPANPINFESDGLSVEMICSASVNPGQVNHMKLAIADTSDQILDSTVMIKAHSLSTTKPESCNDGVDNNDDLLVDGSDPQCAATTTPPPVGSSGIGSGGNAPAFTGNEGTPIPLDASALDWTPSSDTVSTSWTVTGINGTPGTCEVSPAGRLPLNPDGSVQVVTAICPNEGEYVARVDGWDVDGGGAWDTDVDFFVHNAPPAVTIDTPQVDSQVDLGAPVDLSATVTDPGASDTATCDISWGDGTSEPGVLDAGVCSGSHAYADEGSKLVSVTATDNASDSSAAATFLSVNPASYHLAGTVVSATDGAGLGGMRVQAVRPDNSVVRTVTSAPDGSFDLLDLVQGDTYRVRAFDPTVPAGYLAGSTAQLATPAVGVVVEMVQVGHITGTVTSSGTGVGISGIRVQALKADNSIVRTTYTDADGIYDLGGLASGSSYKIRANDVSATPVYVGTSAPGVIPAGSAGVDLEMVQIGHITGTLTSSATGLPVPGIRVQALKADNSIVQTVVSDVDGRYDLGALPKGSSYRVRATDISAVPTFAPATSTSVVVSTAGLDLALVPYAHVSGTVIRLAGGAPMAGVRVQLLRSDNTIIQTVVTGADGTFDLDRALLGTTYKLRYSDTLGPVRFGVTGSAGVAAGTTGIIKAL